MLDVKRRATPHYLFATVGGNPGDLVLWDLDPATGALTPTVVGVVVVLTGAVSLKPLTHHTYFK